MEKTGDPQDCQPLRGELHQHLIMSEGHCEVDLKSPSAQPCHQQAQRRGMVLTLLSSFSPTASRASTKDVPNAHSPSNPVFLCIAPGPLRCT